MGVQARNEVSEVVVLIHQMRHPCGVRITSVVALILSEFLRREKQRVHPDSRTFVVDWCGRIGVACPDFCVPLWLQQAE